MRVHFIGIGGIGLSALARFLNFDGHSVSGSDMKSSSITKEVEKEGIKVSCPQEAKNISDDLDLVIYSAAVTDENPELIEARLKQIRTLSRKEALPIILGDKKNYCVAGAHGKSTTTAILATILQSSALIGAISKEFGSNFRYVDKTVAFEADESDASFLLSNPYCAIVTNAEPEHMEYYHYDYDKFYESYETFLSLAKKRVVNGEDKDIQKLKIEDATYLYPSKDIKNLCYTLKDGQPCTKFDLKDYGTFEVWGFGFHIASNASLAILAALNELDIETIRKNLLNYKGIKKRFDIVQSNEKFVVIDDYAHHPTEINGVHQAVRELYPGKKIIAAFQPHLFSRTKDFVDGFAESLSQFDEILLLEIYPARELPMEGVNSTWLLNKIDNPNKKLVSKDELFTAFENSDADVFITIGAGDIGELVKDLKKALHEKN